MDVFQDLTSKNNVGELLLTILFVIYLVMGYETPPALAHLIDNPVGKVVVGMLAIFLFMSVNPVLGILGFIVAYQLISLSSAGMSYNGGMGALKQYLPTEQKKYTALTNYNQFPYTLEQEIVKKMAPINTTNPMSSNKYSFNAVLDDLHDAAPINYTGVV
jgi:amino acid transporter